MRQISRRLDLQSIDVSLSKTRGFRPSDDPLISSLHSTFLLRSQATWALPQPKCKLPTLWENHPQDDLKILLRPWWPLLIRSLLSPSGLSSWCYVPTLVPMHICSHADEGVHARMFSCWWGSACKDSFCWGLDVLAKYEMCCFWYSRLWSPPRVSSSLLGQWWITVKVLSCWWIVVEINGSEGLLVPLCVMGIMSSYSFEQCFKWCEPWWRGEERRGTPLEPWGVVARYRSPRRTWGACGARLKVRHKALWHAPQGFL